MSTDGAARTSLLKLYGLVSRKGRRQTTMKNKTIQFITIVGAALAILAILIIDTAGASRNEAKQVPPELYKLLSNRARLAYDARMNASLDDNNVTHPQLDTQLAEVYSSARPDSSLGSAINLPPTRPLTNEQRAKMEDSLRGKGIDPKTYLAEQAAVQAQMERLRSLSALERVRAGVETRWKTPEGDLTVAEAWGVESFKVSSVEISGSEATVVAQIRTWTRYRHTASDGKVDIQEPHNGLSHTFHFRQEGDSWKVNDWSFDFLPDEGP